MGLKLYSKWHRDKKKRVKWKKKNSILTSERDLSCPKTTCDTENNFVYLKKFVSH